MVQPLKQCLCVTQKVTVKARKDALIVLLFSVALTHPRPRHTCFSHGYVSSWFYQNNVQKCTNVLKVHYPQGAITAGAKKKHNITARQ